MAVELPTPLQFLTERGLQGKVENALRVTRRNIIIYDTETFRDSPPLVVGGAAYTGSASNPLSNSVAGGTTQSIGGSSTPDFQITAPSSVVQDDGFTHVPKRYVPKITTLIEWWDGEDVGQPMVITATLVSGSAVITVPDSTLLTPGQKITGTNIPTDTVILSTFTQSNGVITTTTATMSQKATGSGDTTATLAGSNKVAECLQTEFLNWCSGNSIPT